MYREKRIVGLRIDECKRQLLSTDRPIKEVLRALTFACRADLALAMVRERYGKLLEAGATAIWEMWQLPEKKDGEVYLSSASHGWGAAPVTFFAETILGIEPIADTFSRFRLRPFIGDLPWAQGKVPTPNGDISIRLVRKEDGVEVSVIVPSGCICETDRGELREGAHQIML